MRRKLLALASALAVGGSVGLAGASALPPAPVFGPPIAFAMPPGEAVSIGDVDGDGTPDLAAPMSSSSAVAVGLGNGDGTFEPMRLYAAGTSGSSVAHGDLTGDGLADLAVTNPFEDGVRVLPGPLPEPSPPGVPEDVSGAVLYPTGDLPRALAVADLATGGTLDLVAGTVGASPADPTDDTVSVLLANGAGGFQPAVEYPAGDVAALALADVDASGDPDIVVANYEANTISVLLGTPSGTFASRTSFGSPVLFLPRALALGDLNGDTRVDLVVGQQGHGLVIFLGNGDGTFAAQPPDASGIDPLTDVNSVEIADLNFDGTPEIVVGTADTVGNPHDPVRVVVLTGRGDGTFGDPLEYPSSSHALVEVADLNMDGRPDLVAGGGDPWVRLNDLPRRGTLLVVGEVVNDDGGTLAAGDFTISVSGGNPSPASFPGQGAPGRPVSLDPGNYSLGITPRAGYAITAFSPDCSSTIAAGQTKTCTITINDLPRRGTLLVVGEVVNDDGGTLAAGDFTISVSGGNPSPASFPGRAHRGRPVSLDPGNYSLGITPRAGYAITAFSPDCSSTIAAGQTKTCTITINDLPRARDAARRRRGRQRRRRHARRGRLHDQRERRQPLPRQLPRAGRTRPPGQPRPRQLQPRHHPARRLRDHRLLARLLQHDRRRPDQNLHDHHQRPAPT